MTTSRHFKDNAYGHLAEVGKALSNAVRLEILELLAQRPRTVESLATEIDQSIANTSHHLQRLLRAQLVEVVRHGLHKEYSLAGPSVAGLVSQLQLVAREHADEVNQLRRDFFSDAAEPVDSETLFARLRSGDAVLIDVRPEEEFRTGHIAGARSTPLADFDRWSAELPQDTTIVAYCRGPFCTFSKRAVELLRERGFDAVRADVAIQDLAIGDAK